MPQSTANRGSLGIFCIQQSNKRRWSKMQNLRQREKVNNLDDEIRKRSIQEQIKVMSGGKKMIVAKYTAKYPDSAEREYLRLANAYMTIEREILIRHIPELKAILNEGTKAYNTDSQDKKANERKRKLARFETLDNTLMRLKILFDNIRRELEAAFGLFDLSGKLKKIAQLDYKLSISEWKKVIGKTFGINLLDDYFRGDYYDEMLKKWISENVDLIKTVPSQSLGKIKELVYKQYMDGSSTTNIIKELQRQYGMDKRHAQLIARDQIGKLNAKITESQQRDAGVKRYKWSDSRDERVRESHRRLHGHIFSWDKPPETDNGRRCHPQQDYQCRCCAIPVFDIENLDSTMGGEKS